MSLYRIAYNHDVPLASLIAVNPQPRSNGVQPTRRTHTGNGVIDEALWCEWIWDGGIDDSVAYQNILIACGLLTTAKWRSVTIYTRNDLFVWTRFNGMAIRPEPVWEQYFPRLTLLIRDLQEIG
jgi:hypothetical protein